MRKKRLFCNVTTALLNQFIMLISSFVLPRLVLTNYGSDVNGLVTSITQFLGFVSLTEMGIGAVVRSSLFAPLAKDDSCEISRIIKSTKKFFRTITIIFVIYIFFLCFIYPKLESSIFDYVFIVSLILTISISTIAQYMFGITNQILLSADQRSYIYLFLNSIVMTLNTLICSVLINKGYSIQMVKLVASIVLLLKPVGMSVYVRKRYNIDNYVVLNGEPIKQKWNGIAQHFAAFVLIHTDVFVLTVFSTLKNVSIYNIYYMVVAGVRQVITTAMTGVEALFGNLYVKSDGRLKSIFSAYELMIHSVVILVFSVSSLLICPFITIYTKGITDAEYIKPVFGTLMSMAYVAYSLRLPYNTMVLAAGHYKQTQNSALIEAVLNIVISIILVNKIGLCGVAIGTLIAMIYRTIYLAFYLSKAILHRKINLFFKHIAVDVIMLGVIFFSCKRLVYTPNNYFIWCSLALKVFVIALIEVVIINVIAYKSDSKELISLLLRRVRD